MLRLRQIGINRPKESALVQGLNISIPEGEILALVGRSGAGKSSLLNVIAGFIRHAGQSRSRSPWQWFDGDHGLTYDGSVLLNEAPIDDVPVENRDTISMVMQGGVVYEHLSVLKNITFPLRVAGVRGRKVLKDAAVQLLDDVDLFDDVDEDERDRFLRSKASKLSGGERQRVALARALAKSPAVLLLDEAFANLDPVLRAELFTRFTALVTGQRRCAVVVTHDLADLKHVNKVLLLSHGATGLAHWFYERRADNRFEVSHQNIDASEYWRTWNERIVAAS
jgi:ABC-type sugar transport system ATPase subunit